MAGLSEQGGDKIFVAESTGFGYELDRLAMIADN